MLKSESLTESFRRVREGRLVVKMVDLNDASRGIMPSRATLEVPIKEIGDVVYDRGPERRTIMEKRLFVGPAWMARASRTLTLREGVN